MSSPYKPFQAAAMPNNSEQTTLLGTDVQGTPLLLQKPQGIQQLSFCAFGYDQASNRMLSLLGFNGEARAPSGYYLLGDGYRAYYSTIMRFGSPDSVSPFDDGGINSYAYCLGDPINLLDSSGHSPEKPSKGILRPTPKNYDFSIGKTTKISFNDAVASKTIAEHSTLYYYPGWENYVGITKKDKQLIQKLDNREAKLKNRESKLELLKIAAKSNTPKDNANYSNYLIKKISPLKEKITATITRLDALQDSQPRDTLSNIRSEI
ncbi:RHS repeat-associated core domain-containing protein [Pseudomonas maumuensis]|nr:RHS repeat-associated core domain-containing protein [Pseudomonas maumuensis]